MLEHTTGSSDLARKYFDVRIHDLNISMRFEHFYAQIIYVNLLKLLDAKIAHSP